MRDGQHQKPREATIDSSEIPTASAESTAMNGSSKDPFADATKPGVELVRDGIKVRPGADPFSFTYDVGIETPARNSDDRSAPSRQAPLPTPAVNPVLSPIDVSAAPKPAEQPPSEHSRDDVLKRRDALLKCRNPWKLPSSIFRFPKYDPDQPGHPYREPDPKMRVGAAPSTKTFDFGLRSKCVWGVIATPLVCTGVTVGALTSMGLSLSLGGPLGLSVESLPTAKAFLGSVPTILACAAWPIGFAASSWCWNVISTVYSKDVVQNAHKEATSAESGWLMARWLSVFHHMVRDESPLLIRKLKPLMPSFGAKSPNDETYLLEKMRQAGVYIFSNFSATGRLDERIKGADSYVSEYRYDQVMKLIGDQLPTLMGRWNWLPGMIHSGTAVAGIAGAVAAASQLAYRFL